MMGKLSIKERIELKKENLEPDEPVFNVLSESKLIKKDLAKNLCNAKSMRNFIVHQYGGISDDMVFFAIKNELIPDAEEFLEVIKNVK